MGRSSHANLDSPWRASTRCTVDAATPTIPPIRAGPNRRARRNPTIRASTSGGVRRGCDRATDERSISPAGPCACQRRHAVVRDTPICAATWATGWRAAILSIINRRPIGVSRRH